MFPLFIFKVNQTLWISDTINITIIVTLYVQNASRKIDESTVQLDFKIKKIMIEHFNGIIYLIIFAIHFLAYAVYGYRCIVSTKSFLDQYSVDYSAAIMTRFFGAMFLGSVIMALYIIFIRPIIHGDIGLENTWAFFNLIFLQNLSAFIVGFYSIKISKLGNNEKTSVEGVIAPGILTLLSAILCYGLADKIYS